MTVAITQPTFLPWLGYFDLIAQSDVFVLLDTVQFEKQSWQSRNRLRTAAGNVMWLTAPVMNMPLNTLIKDICISPNPPSWRRKLTGTLEQNLKLAPDFHQAEALYLNILGPNAAHTMLADMNADFIRATASVLHLSTQIVRSSELPVTGRREELLLNICSHFQATRYYSNAGSAAYLEAARPAFAEVGVQISYQQWKHPKYTQMGSDFVSHLSCLDAIACMGAARAAESLHP